MKLGHTRFQTELQVRPDDIDMNQHVHNSRYFDYVLAARYDQMKRCYGMGMDEFVERGFSWVVKVAHLDFKRPLSIGERIIVTTWIEEMFKDGVKVLFEITRCASGKLCCEGYFDYTMVNFRTGRAEQIPAEIREKYGV